MSEIACQQAKPPVGEIIPVNRATSSRNQGRHHLGLAGRHRRNPQRGDPALRAKPFWL
jgi:hypothetical protein